MGDHAPRRGQALIPPRAGGDAVPDAAALEPGLIEAGRKLFAAEARFVFGAAKSDGLPKISLPEVAIAGRSNVGKSSLINALTARKNLARTSQTPGRTRQLNFFELGGQLLLVDLPGYGYAKVSKDESADWNALIRAYLQGRPTLKRLLLLIDARRGIMASDRDAMKLLDQAAVGFQIVLTKADQCRDAALAALSAEIGAEIRHHPAGHPDVLATSAESGAGIDYLRGVIASLARAR
jgi:GTP-binding protein